MSARPRFERSRHVRWAASLAVVLATLLLLVAADGSLARVLEWKNTSGHPVRAGTVPPAGPPATALGDTQWIRPRAVGPLQATLCRSIEGLGDSAATAVVAANVAVSCIAPAWGSGSTQQVGWDTVRTRRGLVPTRRRWRNVYNPGIECASVYCTITVEGTAQAINPSFPFSGTAHRQVRGVGRVAIGTAGLTPFPRASGSECTGTDVCSFRHTELVRAERNRIYAHCTAVAGELPGDSPGDLAVRDCRITSVERSGRALCILRSSLARPAADVAGRRRRCRRTTPPRPPFVPHTPTAPAPDYPVAEPPGGEQPPVVSRCEWFHQPGCVTFHGGIASGGDHRRVATGDLEIQLGAGGYCGSREPCRFDDCYVCPHLDTAFPHGATVTAIATPDDGMVFARWGQGACSGQGPTCTFTATKNSCITAQFLLANPTAPPQSLPTARCREDPTEAQPADPPRTAARPPGTPRTPRASRR